MASEIIWAVVSCLITLSVTTIFNYCISQPKKKKQEKEQEKLEREKELKVIEEKLDSVKSEISTQLDEIKKENKFQSEGLQAVIKNDLKVRYLKWIKARYAPIDAKDDLERMYKCYHNLGANGVMDNLRQEFLELPETPPKGVKRITEDKDEEE